MVMDQILGGEGTFLLSLLATVSTSPNRRGLREPSGGFMGLTCRGWGRRGGERAAGCH